MAREGTGLGERGTNAEAGETPDIGGKSGLLRRRGYLRAAAATATGTVAALVASGTAAASEYETITVDAGDHRVIRVGAGETLENTLIDVTAAGASATIDAHAPNTTIRNVGIEGRMDDPPTGIIGVSDTGGATSIVENVYLGDGASRGHRHGLGIWTSSEHTGHLVVDRVNIQEMGDNSFYCSAPGGRGSVAFTNCYSANSWVSHFRLARGTVENCVALNDERHQDGRGVWAWSPGAVEVRDCDLEMNGRHYAVVAGANGSASEVRVVDSQFDTDFHGGIRRASGSSVELVGKNGHKPDGSRIPEGCPTSAAEAASGESATYLDAHRLELAGQFAYRVEVDGTIEPAPDHAQWLTEGDAYGDDWAEWWLSGNEDARTEWLVSGELTDLVIESHDGETDVRSVRLDGEELDPDDF